MIAVAEKEIVLWCSFQLASELRPCTTSMDHKSDEFLKYPVERKIMEERRESIQSAGKKMKCVREAARNVGLRLRMKQTLSDRDRVPKRAARERLLSLL